MTRSPMRNSRWAPWVLWTSTLAVITIRGVAATTLGPVPLSDSARPAADRNGAGLGALTSAAGSITVTAGPVPPDHTPKPQLASTVPPGGANAPRGAITVTAGPPPPDRTALPLAARPLSPVSVPPPPVNSSLTSTLVATRRESRAECPDPSYVLRFKGLGDGVVVGDGPEAAFRPPSANFTFEAWVRPVKAEYLDGIAGNLKVVGKNCQGFGLYFDGHRNTVARMGVPGPTSWREDCAAYSDLDRWSHVAVVVGPESTGLYVDSELASSIPIAGEIQYAAGVPFTFGRLVDASGQTHGFGGYLTEVRLWSHPRRVTDVKKYMHQPLTSREIGLLEYWAMSEGEGTLVNSLVAGGHQAAFMDPVGAGVDWYHSHWPCHDCDIDCLHDGTMDMGECQCECPRPWRGQQCEECPLECHNGGTLDLTDCKCECPPGTSGDTCAGPAVFRVYPNHGPAAGGYIITVIGSGFAQFNSAGYPTSFVGGHRCQETVVDTVDPDTKLTCLVPAGLGPDQSVTVSIGNLTAPALNNSLFTYDKPVVPPPQPRQLRGGAGTAAESADDLADDLADDASDARDSSGQPEIQLYIHAHPVPSDIIIHRDEPE